MEATNCTTTTVTAHSPTLPHQREGEAAGGRRAPPGLIWTMTACWIWSCSDTCSGIFSICGAANAKRDFELTAPRTHFVPSVPSCITTMVRGTLQKCRRNSGSQKRARDWGSHSQITTEMGISIFSLPTIRCLSFCITTLVTALLRRLDCDRAQRLMEKATLLPEWESNSRTTTTTDFRICSSRTWPIKCMRYSVTTATARLATIVIRQASDG